MLKGLSEVCEWNKTFRHSSFAEIHLQILKYDISSIFIQICILYHLSWLQPFDVYNDKIIYITDKLFTEKKTLINNRFCHMNAIHTTGIIHNCNVIFTIKGSPICTKKKVNKKNVFHNKK